VVQLYRVYKALIQLPAQDACFEGISTFFTQYFQKAKRSMGYLHMEGKRFCRYWAMEKTIAA
jgi:hypothetical protein